MAAASGRKPDYRLLVDPALPGAQGRQKEYAWGDSQAPPPTEDPRRTRTDVPLPPPLPTALPMPPLRRDPGLPQLPPARAVVLAGVPPEADEDGVMRFCEQIVPVESVEVLRMPRTEEPLRLARVQLATPAAALRLLREGHGRAMDGHPVSTFLDSGEPSTPQSLSDMLLRAVVREQTRSLLTGAPSGSAGLSSIVAAMIPKTPLAPRPDLSVILAQRPAHVPAVAPLGPRTPPSPTMGPRTPPSPTMGPRTPPSPTMGPRTPPSPTMGPRTPPSPTMGGDTPPSPGQHDDRGLHMHVAVAVAHNDSESDVEMEDTGASDAVPLTVGVATQHPLLRTRDSTASEPHWAASSVTGADGGMHPARAARIALQPTSGLPNGHGGPSHAAAPAPPYPPASAAASTGLLASGAPPPPLHLPPPPPGFPWPPPGMPPPFSGSAPLFPPPPHPSGMHTQGRSQAGMLPPPPRMQPPPPRLPFPPPGGPPPRPPGMPGMPPPPPHHHPPHSMAPPLGLTSHGPSHGSHGPPPHPPALHNMSNIPPPPLPTSQSQLPPHTLAPPPFRGALPPPPVLRAPPGFPSLAPPPSYSMQDGAPQPPPPRHALPHGSSGSAGGSSSTGGGFTAPREGMPPPPPPGMFHGGTQGLPSHTPDARFAPPPPPPPSAAAAAGVPPSPMGVDHPAQRLPPPPARRSPPPPRRSSPPPRRSSPPPRRSPVKRPQTPPRRRLEQGVWDLLRGDLVKFARRQLRRTVVEDTLNRAVDAFLKRQQERQEAERQEQLRRAERLKAEQLERLRQSQLQLQRDLKPRLEDGIDNAAAKASAVQPGMPAASDAPDLKSRVFSIKIERHPGAPLRRPLAADEAATAADMSSPKKPAASARRSSIEEPRARRTVDTSSEEDSADETEVDTGPASASLKADSSRPLVRATSPLLSASSLSPDSAAGESDDEDMQSVASASSSPAPTPADSGKRLASEDSLAAAPETKRAKPADTEEARKARAQAKAARAAVRNEERAQRQAAAAAEAATAAAAERAAAAAAAAADARRVAEEAARDEVVLGEARALPLPQSLATEAPAAAKQQAGEAAAAVLRGLDVEDVEAALAALDDLESHAHAAGATWSGGAGAFQSATALRTLRAYFPSLLRACHRQVAPPDVLAPLDALRAAALAAPAEVGGTEQAQHASGAARAEGYYFVKASDKKERLAAGRQQQPTEKRSKALVREPSRNNRREARNLASALALEDLDDVAAEMVRLNALKVRRRHLRFGRSVIHEWGLFAMEDIPANAMVIEYVGEVIRQSVADDRERRYADLGIGSSYLFRIDENDIIDATRCGAIARFMNHSCDPNCYAQVVQVEGDSRIVIYSKRAIASGTEITYDYKFPIEDEKIPCYCGAATCRGTLN